MSWLPNPIACDVCGVIKQPSNNWYYAEIRPSDKWAEYKAKTIKTASDKWAEYKAETTKTASIPDTQNFFLIRPWDAFAEQDHSKPYTHLCGQACAIRKLNEYMSPLPPPLNDPTPCSQAVIQQQENPEPVQPQWTEDGPMKGQNE